MSIANQSKNAKFWDKVILLLEFSSFLATQIKWRKQCLQLAGNSSYYMDNFQITYNHENFR